MIRRTFKYRIYPTKRQIELLEWTLERCCELYNAALQERRDAWRINRISVGFNAQSAQLVEIKRERREYAEVYAQVLQDALHRVDKTFKAFFGRVKRGVKAGFPRFKSRSHYDSFTYPQDGFAFKDGKLRLSKIGKVRIKLHREMEGKVKTCTVKREAGRWYVCFSVEGEAQPLPVSDESIGIDVGLTTFATLSDGTEIKNPRWYHEAQMKLRRAQHKVARRRKGSLRRHKAVRMLQRIHAHIRNQRADFHHKIARTLVNNYGIIVVEDLNIKGLVKGMLAKSVSDAGWSAFIAQITYKAESARRDLLKVDPRGTSQRCTCGRSVPKKLKDRWHECLACGLSVGRDHASALEILRLGLSRQAPTWPDAASVA
jgi:putative transposase